MAKSKSALDYETHRARGEEQGKESHQTVVRAKIFGLGGPSAAEEIEWLRDAKPKIEHLEGDERFRRSVDWLICRAISMSAATPEALSAAPGWFLPYFLPRWS